MGAFENILNDKDYLIYTNVGNSMLPLIKEGIDILVIKKPQRNIKKYDIVLSKRPSGRYILHRVISLSKNMEELVIAGDNSFMKDCISPSSVLGILSEIHRNGEEVKMDTLLKRLAVWFWCNFFFIRRPIIKIFNKHVYS